MEYHGRKMMNRDDARGRSESTGASCAHEHVQVRSSRRRSSPTPSAFCGGSSTRGDLLYLSQYDKCSLAIGGGCII
jgi:hypothetical protein